MPKVKQDMTKADFSAADKVMRKMTGSQFPDKTKLGLLPLIGEVFTSEQEIEEGLEILERGHRLKEEVDSLEGQLKETKLAATALIMGAGVDGYRFGSLAVTSIIMPGRSTLNKDLLRVKMIEAGVDPTVVGRIIEDSHVQGEGFYMVKFEKAK